MLKAPLLSLVVTVSSIFFIAPAAVFADGPVIAYDPAAGGVEVVTKEEVGGDVDATFAVKARGAREVAAHHGSLNGVLFQATARPETSLRGLPIKLSYSLAGNHDAVLRVTIDGREAASDAPAWVWAVAAKFADHEATGAVTLSDNPQTPAEKRFHRRWRDENRRHRRLVWARYHPAIDDTLIGFVLVAADALIGDAEHVRTITRGLAGLDNYSRDSLTLDEEASRRAARSIDELVRLEAKPGDTAMLNDVDEPFTFSIDDGKLHISGNPRYRFSRKADAGAYQPIAGLDEIFQKNGRLLREANPFVGQTVADFARLVAFFNYIDETDPQQLDAFIKDLKPVLDRIPTAETPLGVELAAPFRR